MDPNSLKTSWKRRIVIIVIAILLLGSTIATYVGIVVSSGNKSNSSTSELEEQYTDKQAEINNYAVTLSDKYFSSFANYRSEVKAYNAEAANSVGVHTRDLLEGTGRELATGDLEYYAYYIGFCPDESVFDSSFNDYNNPTQLLAPIYAGQGLIQGWNAGVVGMKIGGVREIQMPGEQAYGDSREICGMTNAPLKFIVMAIEDEKLNELNNEFEQLYAEIVSRYYNSAN
ncbi:FKBP-type peptidyl-prolyl cis-trans isomerase [Candidatus Saccharibacteria bacterium]|nr:FKBP-type peptidyl-prolyl cis-trans isomerase [Candidatus Saccharibacteria bacterium]